MNITCGVWQKLTSGERMCVLQFAVDENAKRWAKKIEPLGRVVLEQSNCRYYNTKIDRRK